MNISVGTARTSVESTSYSNGDESGVFRYESYPAIKDGRIFLSMVLRRFGGHIAIIICIL